MQKVILIRPLHFIDILRDFGAGVTDFEPDPSGNGLHIVAEKLLNNRDILLAITLDPDDVCKPCKHNINGICDEDLDRTHRPSAPCLMRDWDLLINQRWCERLEIRQGDRFTARELCERLRDRAGDIKNIYREIVDSSSVPDWLSPSKRTFNLKKGIKRFLGE